MVVAAEYVRAVVIYRTGRVHGDGRSHYSTVGILVPCHHAFGVDVELQIVVEEGGSQIDGGGETLEVGSLDNTVLVGIAQ